MGKIVRLVVLSGAVIALIFGLLAYNNFISANQVPALDDPWIEIPTNSSFDEVVDLLKSKGVVTNETSFRWLADYMEYKRDPMRAGRYKLEEGWTGIQLIRHLRGGKQSTMRVVLNSARMLDDVAGKSAKFLEMDSSDIMGAFNDKDYIRGLGYSKQTLMSIFIPNSYDVYWNSSPTQFVERMKKEHDLFWDKDGRRQKAEALNLSPEEVYTLASIVERETTKNDEKRRMAGVYLNRLRKGMLLQADPTAVFARKDFAARRVTDYHITFDSPYNTYMYKGLPPGPISMASIASIDAVLNGERHDYVYFCAKGDGTGYHNFAKTLAQHNRNAATYRANLRKRGLR